MRTCVIGSRTTGRNHPPNVEWWPHNPSWSNGHDGCRAAHTDVWGSVTAHTIVLEDDAVCLPVNWGELWSQSRHWDLLYLGGQPIKWNPPHDLKANRLPPNLMWGRSHAYIIGPAAAAALLKHRWHPGLPWTHDVTWRDDLDIGYLWPPIAGQAAGYSQTLKVDLPELWWHTEYDAMTARGVNVIDTLTDLAKEIDNDCQV